MKDTEIIELFFSRSQDAIKETDAKYGSLLKKISANILHNQEDCEEAIADTYLTLARSIDYSFCSKSMLCTRTP